jgi:hypothetical protein
MLFASTLSKPHIPFHTPKLCQRAFKIHPIKIDLTPPPLLKTRDPEK